jgi:hypothetical protein
MSIRVTARQTNLYINLNNSALQVPQINYIYTMDELIK